MDDSPVLFISYAGGDPDVARCVDVVRLVAQEQRWHVTEYRMGGSGGFRGGQPSVIESQAKVRGADALLAIVGNQGGTVPGPDSGGDGIATFCQHEWRAAAGSIRSALIAEWATPGHNPLRDEVSTGFVRIVGEDPVSIRAAAKDALDAMYPEVMRRRAARHRTEAARASLRPGFLTRPSDPSPTDLLRAEYRFIPRLGRDRELQDAFAWCLSDHEVSAQLIVAPGGAGKSRFAAELCERLETHGWIAGFASAGLDDVGESAHRLAATGMPTLVVLDYGESHTGDLLRWARSVSSATWAAKRRLMVLSRTHDWWRDVAGDASEEPQRRMLRDAAVTRLAPVAATGPERRALFAAAAAAFADVIDDKKISVHLPGFDLNRPPFDLALFVAIAALASIEGAEPETEVALLDYVIEREVRYLGRALADRGVNVSRAQRRQALAAATLMPQEERNAVPLLQRVPKLSHLTPETLDTLARSINSIYGRPWAWLGPVRPDRVGERLAAAELTADGLLLEALLVGAGPESVLDALETLLLASANHETAGDVAAKLVTTRPELLLAAFAAQPRPLLAYRLSTALPDRSVALAALAASSTGQVVDKLRAEAASRRGALALWLNNLGVRLGRIGRFEDAERSLAESVAIRRELASDGAAAAIADLAVSLGNHANALAELGLHDRALDVASEAVEINRLLAERSEPASQPRLATSLNNLANRLASIGRREEAALVSEEAAARWHTCAAAGEARAPAELAMTLNNLSGHLAAVGQHAAALDSIARSVEMYRSLAADQSDAFEPSLAAGLANLGARLGDLERGAEGLAAAEEAVALYESLDKRAPGLFADDLADAMNILANSLGVMGRDEEAIAVMRNALRIERERATRDPNARTAALAMCMHNLSARLGETGAVDEAVELARRAAALRRELAEGLPTVHGSDLALSLLNLGLREGAAGNPDEAQLALEESISRYRTLATDRPHVFRTHLVKALAVAARLLMAQGSVTAAAALSGEALELVTDADPGAAGVATLTKAAAEVYLAACRTLDQTPDTTSMASARRVLGTEPES